MTKETRETGWWQQIGHGILATEALSHGLSVKIIDASTYESQDEFLQVIRENHRATIAGLTPSITSKKNTIHTLETLREIDVEAIVVGGHMVSQFRTLLNVCRDYSHLIDAVCIGDGRGVFSEGVEKMTLEIKTGGNNLVSTYQVRDNGLEREKWKSILQKSFSASIEVGHPIPYSEVFDLGRYWENMPRITYSLKL